MKYSFSARPDLKPKWMALQAGRWRSLPFSQALVFSWLKLFLVAGWMVAGQSQSAAWQDEGVSADRAAVETWIRQLGDQDYVRRELAGRELMAIGAAALPPLENVLSPTSSVVDNEIRWQAQRLLILIRRDDFRMRRKMFLEGSDDAGPMIVDHGLQGWRSFVALVGDSRESRELFMGMYESQEDIFQALPCEESSLRRKLEKAQASEYRTSSSAGRFMDSICAFMFLAAAPSADLGTLEDSSQSSTESGNQLRPSAARIGLETGKFKLLCAKLTQPEIVNYVKTCRHRKPIEVLIGYWLTRTGVEDPVRVSSQLSVIQKYELADQQSFLFTILNDRAGAVELRIQSLECVLDVNEESAVVLLQPLLNDESFIGRFPHPDGGNRILELQFRDLVLATCGRLSNQSLDQFGYLPELERVSKNSPGLNRRRLGFSDSVDRKLAFRKWSGFWQQKTEGIR